MNERDSSKEWTCPKPMLAYAKPPEIPVSQYGALGGWIAEPKVDGIRITLRRRSGAVLAWTRPGPGRPDGKIRQLPQQVVDAVSQLPDGVYDGELAIAGAASWDVQTDANDSTVSFFPFDVLEMLGEEVVRQPWHVRRQILELACQAVQSPFLQIVPVVDATDAEYDRVLDAGGEGLMLKHRDSVYRPGARTKQWLKVKPTERAVLFIEGYEAAIRGPHAVLKLVDSDGNHITISTPTKVMQIADRDEQLLMQRPVVVKYQMRTAPSDRCPTGSYRHPRMDVEQTYAKWEGRK